MTNIELVKLFCKRYQLNAAQATETIASMKDELKHYANAGEVNYYLDTLERG